MNLLLDSYLNCVWQRYNSGLHSYSQSTCRQMKNEDRWYIWRKKLLLLWENFIANQRERKKQTEQRLNPIERKEKERKIFSQNGLNMVMMPWRLSPISATQRNISTEICVLRMHKNKSQCCHQQWQRQRINSNYQPHVHFHSFILAEHSTEKHKTHISWLSVNDVTRNAGLKSNYECINFIHAIRHSVLFMQWKNHHQKESRQPYRSKWVL